jgi:acyl-coenzyme A synthetase/AMP-(fatty) acid ligase
MVPESVAEHRINVFRASPVFFQRMADLPAFADADLTSLRVTTMGGSAPAEKLLTAWRGRVVLLRQLDGQTEGAGRSPSTPHVSRRAIRIDADTARHSPRSRSSTNRAGVCHPIRRGRSWRARRA